MVTYCPLKRPRVFGKLACAHSGSVVVNTASLCLLGKPQPLFLRWSYEGYGTHVHGYYLVLEHIGPSTTPKKPRFQTTGAALGSDECVANWASVTVNGP